MDLAIRKSVHVRHVHEVFENVPAICDWVAVIVVTVIVVVSGSAVQVQILLLFLLLLILLLTTTMRHLAEVAVP